MATVIKGGEDTMSFKCGNKSGGAGRVGSGKWTLKSKLTVLMESI